MDTAFEILVREHAAMLTAYVRSVIGDDNLVDDIFQRTIITAWRKLDDFDTDRPFGPWLRGIARNHMLGEFRSAGRYRRRLEGLFAERIESGFAAVDARSGDSYAERISILTDCIRDLPEPNREAVDLVYLRDLTRTDAARQANLEFDALRKRLDRGLRLLAECLHRKGLLPETAA